MQTIEEKFSLLKNKQDVLILAFESSCDETSVAVIKNGREILSNVISSQISIHEKFGGVVPEVASRNHITAISNVTELALKQANCTFNDIDALAVTYGAGLVGALLVGINYAKSLAYALQKPLVAVSHIEGHISANYLTHKQLEPPFLCLLMSGGHTALLHVTNYNEHELIGTTVDDAVGEAFDKVARVVGLGYPGGPKVDKLAKQGEPNINFINKSIMPNSCNFSFSGLKTCVINYVNMLKQKNEDINVPNLCASFQSIVAKELCDKAMLACQQTGLNKLVLAGGVSANSFIQKTMKDNCIKHGIALYCPDLILCTDNAAMIGSSAYYMIKSGIGLAPLNLTAQSCVKL